ncbi:MAG: glycoside hydrolase family 2 [Prevotellaceae bacterium]|nr:glycoside hydrolase family 2 [Prevotellaceae bacterium]
MATFMCAILLTDNVLMGQSLTHLWTGLQNRQPAETLPVGKALFQIPNRKPKVKQIAPVQPVFVYSGEWIIDSGWELATNTQLVENGESIFSSEFNSDDWLNATVPGTVLTTLVEQGVYPDPYFGLNNMAIPDTLCRMDWWYRNVFECPANTGEYVSLLFNGINYRAEIFLNGKKLGNIEGAFIRGEFDVSSLIRKDRQNVLAVHILPPNNPGIPHEQSIVAGQGLNGGATSIDGPAFLASMGWDWIPGIRDRNIGIWQDVRLKTGNAVKIIDPQIITALPALPDTSQATIAINLKLQNRANRPVEGKLSAKIDGLLLETSYSLSAKETKTVYLSAEKYPQLLLKNPRLWWPNGYGNQELYTMEIGVTDGNSASDTKKLRFGIREMSYELMVNDAEKGNVRIAYTPTRLIKNGKPVFDYDKRTAFDRETQLPSLQDGIRLADFEPTVSDDPMGAYLVIRVNGVRIFCRGGNWGMDDAMKRSSRQRLEPYMKLHRNLNFNIVRNWTGESTEEVFYELCDEYGMLVWNDFWITTDDTVEPNDHALFMRNAVDVVRRFRNHPSIAVWCPRNEGFAPKGLSKPLTKMLAEEDPTRHYHGQSCKLNMPNSGPWSYFDDPSQYYTQKARGFNSEMGCYAIPVAATIRKFIAPEDHWPLNDVWAYHDLHHTSQNFTGFMAAVNRYGEAKNMEDFVRKAQFVTYDAWRSMLEAWNSKMWNTASGLILWMSHPAWYSMIWQTYTWDCETPGSYFGAKKACEPLHVQMNLPDRDIAIVNTTRNDARQLTVSLRCFDLMGKELERQTRVIDCPANSLTPTELKVKTEGKPELFLLRLELKTAKGFSVSLNDYWIAGDTSAYLQFDKLKSPDLQIVKRLKGDRLSVELRNRSTFTAAGIKLSAINSATGEIILPAYFSDGYINLLPNEKRTVELSIDKQFLKNCIIDWDKTGTGVSN